MHQIHITTFGENAYEREGIEKLEKDVTNT